MFCEVILIALCSVVTAWVDHHECMRDGVVGDCVNIQKCQTTLDGTEKRRDLKICGYDPYKNEVLVCCFEHVPTSTAPTTTRSWQTPTDEEDDSCEEYGTCNQNVKNTCELAPRTGQKAWDMCLEYHEILMNPCQKNNAFDRDSSRSNKICPWDAKRLVVGGTNAQLNEFPHMALLGSMISNESDINWVCGGSLISDKFILTAGHCIDNRMHGVVSYAYIGALTREEVTNNPDLKYGIKAIIRHPDYNPPNKYNDIALLELDRKVNLNEKTVPACLPVYSHLEDYKAIATGWGLTTFQGSSSDVLQKVELTKFTLDKCYEFYPPFTRGLNKGFNETTQICYGDAEKAKDTCQGDSGGPLQILDDNIFHCMYLVIGITSAGHACGFPGQPGVYTQVSYYMPWIESVVWP